MKNENTVFLVAIVMIFIIVGAIGLSINAQGEPITRINESGDKMIMDEIGRIVDGDINKQGENPLSGGIDEHGCLNPAGYTWCELKQKCLGAWEEDCAEQ